MKQKPFDSFVIFAGMRTGSNFLEASLNEINGVTCLGEVFNPSFVGYPNRSSLFGMDFSAREARPLELLEKIKHAEDELMGFRFFHDHDPRVLSAVLADVRCAKIMLSRSVLDSYVSWKLAQETGQWKLRHLRKRRKAQAHFDLMEYLEFEESVVGFQTHVRRTLQESGQTAFSLHYEDLREVPVLNGLATFLGLSERLSHVSTRTTVQNPEPLSQKVSNYQEMTDKLSALSVERATVPVFVTPARHAAIKSYVGGAECPLLYMPIQPASDDALRQWLAQIDDVPETALSDAFSWSELRTWKRRHPRFRSFTIVRHPVVRAHTAFCMHILDPDGAKTFKRVRRSLQRDYGFDFPPDLADIDAHRHVFLQFLEFLKANLAGQTSIRTDGAWCTQSSAITGFAQHAAPDFIWREEEVADALPALVQRLTGRVAPPLDLGAVGSVPPVALDAVYDNRIETCTAEVYQRDYLQFGFGRWK